MTAERARAYRRVIQTLNELGPSKLQEEEQDRIRDAADSLLFTDDLLQDDAACQALSEIECLCRALVDSGRWERATALRLADDVADCGPAREAELEAA